MNLIKIYKERWLSYICDFVILLFTFMVIGSKYITRELLILIIFFYTCITIYRYAI